MENKTIAVGLKKDRVEGLHDAIYAVSMTLLVLDLHVPQGVTSFSDFLRQLNTQLPEFYAGAIAFSVVGAPIIRSPAPCLHSRRPGCGLACRAPAKRRNRPAVARKGRSYGGIA